MDSDHRHDSESFDFHLFSNGSFVDGFFRRTQIIGLYDFDIASIIVIIF